MRLKGVGDAEALLVPAAPSWPELELVRTTDEEATPGGDFFSSSVARVVLQTGGEVAIEREPGRATFRTPRVLTADEVVHPYLAPVASIVAYWLERESFHAGAFVGGGRVWGLAGERESGKSSTLAWLAREGYPVVSDDMLILEGSTAFAAPRSIDLRREAAEALGVGDELGLIGARERWRLVLDQVEGPLELGGWVFLDWGEELEASLLSGAERVVLLTGARGIRLPPHDEGAVLELATLPAWRVRRPRGFDSLPAAGSRLLELTAG